MADFTWPVFEGEPLDGARTWSATHDSYDQYHDVVYYALRISKAGAVVAAFTVKLGMEFAPDLNNWTTPGFVPALRAALAEQAAVGESDTTHVAYALR